MSVSSGWGRGEKLACIQSPVDARLSAGCLPPSQTHKAQPEDADKATHTHQTTRQRPQQCAGSDGTIQTSFVLFHFIPLMLSVALVQSLSLSQAKPVHPWRLFPLLVPPQGSGCHPLPDIRFQGHWGEGSPSLPTESASAGLPWGPRTSIREKHPGRGIPTPSQASQALEGENLNSEPGAGRQDTLFQAQLYLTHRRPWLVTFPLWPSVF